MAETSQSWLSWLATGAADTIMDVARWGINTPLEGYDLTNDLLQSKYDFNYLTFPNDLGMDYYGHYMVININVPTEGLSFGNEVRAAAGKYTNQFNVVNPGEHSTVDTLRFGSTSPNGGVTANATSGSRNFFAIPRQTRRIKESIALFMPHGLNFNTANDYENISLANKVGNVMASPIDALTGGALSGAADTLTKLGRKPINPSVEIVYSTTNLRKFDFTFLFAPKNEQESINLESIIKTIRFHAAPEIDTTSTLGLGMGMTWIPPAEFDIMFFNKGVENRHIPRINTCVLEAINLDYHPDNGFYATFTNGHPVKVMMQLSFIEVEPIHKQRVLQGFY